VSATSDVAPGDDHAPSARVRLELALLDADGAASGSPSPTPDERRGERAGPTLLVVAGEADVRCYVRECLRRRADVHVIDAAGVEAAVALAGRVAPALLVVDAPERAVVDALPEIAAVVLVDESPRGAARAGAVVRFLARPFSADALLSAVAPFLD